MDLQPNLIRLAALLQQDGRRVDQALNQPRPGLRVPVTKSA